MREHCTSCIVLTGSLICAVDSAIFYGFKHSYICIWNDILNYANVVNIYLNMPGLNCRVCAMANRAAGSLHCRLSRRAQVAYANSESKNTLSIPHLSLSLFLSLCCLGNMMSVQPLPTPWRLTTKIWHCPQREQHTRDHQCTHPHAHFITYRASDKERNGMVRI